MLQHLRIINLILCISAVMSCSTLPSKTPTWLSGFRYRIPISVLETSGYDLTNYQVKIDIQWENPQEPNYVDFSRIQPNRSDFRFTDNWNRLINFWIKSWDDTNKTAIIWIKIPELQARLRNTVFMYYGIDSPINNGEMKVESFDQPITKLTYDSEVHGIWHMDEGKNDIQDSSQYKNHSSIFNATWIGKDGGQSGNGPDYDFTKGNALSFDGKTNYVEIPYSQSLDFTDQNAISIEAWIAPMTCGDYAPIISKPGNYSLYIMSDGRLCCYLYGPKPEDYYYSKTHLPFDSWSHIALIYDGKKLRFYINSKCDNEFRLTGAFKPCLDRIHNIEYRKASLYFAYDPLSPVSKYWKGSLDEVRILSRPLIEGEIIADYERRTFGRSEPKVTIGVAEEFDTIED